MPSPGHLVQNKSSPFTYCSAPKCENNMKIIWERYGNALISQFHYIFTCVSYYFIFVSHFWPRDPDSGPKNHIFVIFLVIFYSYYFHILITFWGSGHRSGSQKSYFCNIPGHICFILFSYLYHILGLRTQIRVPKIIFL